jgi:hypothetical protein
MIVAEWVMVWLSRNKNTGTKPSSKLINNGIN